MRIGMVYFNSVSGVTTYAESLSRGLERLGHTVKPIFINIDREFSPQSGTEIPKLLNWNVYFILPSAKTANKVMEAVADVDIVHWNVPFTHFDYFLARAAETKPLVCSIHHQVTETVPYKWLCKFMYWHLSRWFRHSRYLFASSVQQCRWLREMGFRNVVNIPNWVDVDLFKPPKDDTDRRDLVYIGRISLEKGIVDAIKAFLAIKNREVRLHIAGQGPMLKRLRKKYSSERIIFHGYVDEETKIGLLQSSAAFILPTHMDLTSIALLEAMACGCVPIASAVGGIKDIIRHGKDGFLARPGDRGQMAGFMQGVIDGDRERAALSAAARHRVVDSFDQKRNIKKFIDVYEQALSAQKPASPGKHLKSKLIHGTAR